MLGDPTYWAERRKRFGVSLIATVFLRVGQAWCGVAPCRPVNIGLTAYSRLCHMELRQVRCLCLACAGGCEETHPRATWQQVGRGLAAWLRKASAAGPA